MNYQTGDYIRFHTPEQWQQIVEKLERDGQTVLTSYSEEDCNIALMSVPEGWHGDVEVDRFCQNDITDKFFEAVLQDELCSNPPLEVGDSYEILVEGCYLISGVVEENYLKDLDSSWEISIRDRSGKELEFKVVGYKQANPTQEDWRVCRMKKCEYDFKDGDTFIATSELSHHSCECVVEGLEVVMKGAGYGFTDLAVSLKDMVNEIEQERITITNYQAACKLTEVENTFNNILTVNRKGDYVETVSVFSDHSEATFYYWKDFEVVGDVTLNKIELQHYVEKLQKMLSDMD